MENSFFFEWQFNQDVKDVLQVEKLFFSWDFPQ